MWTREELKTRAKSVLRHNYWQAFVVALIVCLLGAEGGGGGGSGRASQYNESMYYSRMDTGMILGIIAVIIVVFVIAFALRFFVGYMIKVGGRKFFIKAAEGDSKIGYVGSMFNREAYWDVFKTLLYQDVMICLWTLLLIIPGVIKSYAYRMVPYILADNPNIGYKRALELSNAMTMDQKFDIFVLDLSFIGWYLLGAIAFGVGILFVNPYSYATNAELYIRLREDALEKGLCTYEELKLR